MTTALADNASSSIRSTPVRAAIYTRISADPDGLRAGVERQRADCLALAERDGSTVVGTYEDNDRSAYSGKPRPAFERLLADAADGVFDAVIVWASDRLYRLMKDLIRITAELAPHARIITVMGGGEVDLTTAEGIMRAQTQGMVGEFESRRKSERVTAAAKQRREVRGRFTASRRPFGWRWADPCPAGVGCEHARTDLDNVERGRCTVPGRRPRAGSKAGLVIDDSEAPAIVAAMQMIADGGSLRAVARMLNERGHTSPSGRPFTADTARIVVMNPRHAGLVGYGGVVVAEAADPAAIVPVERFQQVVARLSDPARRTSPGRPANTPLSGIASCGKCGGPMNATNAHQGGGQVVAVYSCSRHRHLTRRRTLVDAPVLDVVGDWLVEHRDEITAQAQPATAGPQAAAAREIDALTDRLDTLRSLVADGVLDPTEFAELARRIRDRLTRARTRAMKVNGRPATARLLGSDDVSAAWARLVAADDVEPLRTVLREVLAAVEVHPAATRYRPSDADLTVLWAEWMRGIGDAVVGSEQIREV